VSGGGGGFLGLLALLFIFLKLTGKLTWSWWWVTCPLWAPLAILIVVIVLILFAAILKD
jgi:hypothetical protein